MWGDNQGYRGPGNRGPGDDLKGGFAMTAAAMIAMLASPERSHKRKQARALRTPEEILTMPHNQALVMASGYGIPPFLAEKVPYYTQKSYRGLFAPNPYFDRDLTKVHVPAWWGGSRSLRVITEQVPSSHAHLPQYQNGQWSFIEGYRPKG